MMVNKIDKSITYCSCQDGDEMKYPLHRHKCHCEHDMIELKCPMDKISIESASINKKY